jgi:hypothetical protein
MDGFLLNKLAGVTHWLYFCYTLTMKKITALIIGLLIIIIALLAYVAFKPKPSPTPTQVAPITAVDSVTGLRYPVGFSVAPVDQNLLARFVKGSEFIEIAEKYPNDPTCEKFYQEENFGFCVKGFHGEASSDEVANLFINLNK